jgi:tetratricopeptide (TPR) repeat protein
MRRMLMIFAAVAILQVCWVGTAAAASPPKLAPQLGKVNFPTSCAAPVQRSIVTGVALLHSFQYQQAAQTFEDVTKQDPKCAIGYWGEAMSIYHQLWDFPDDAALKQGREWAKKATKLHAPTDRERGYIVAVSAFYQDLPGVTSLARTVAYSNSMQQLTGRYPEDEEAAAFYALSLIALAEMGQDDLPNRKKAIAILQPLFAKDPDNPGFAHYLIHACDMPQLAPQGLAAARGYAQIAPDSAHALHMPSHIFARLGLWKEMIDSNLAAAAAAANASRAHTEPAHYQLHALDYLDYAYLQSGQDAQAAALVGAVKAVPGASTEEITEFSTIFAARNAIEEHRWKDAASLTIPDAKPSAQRETYFARALGAARSGDAAAAEKDVEKLAEILAAEKASDTAKGYKTTAGESPELFEARAWLALAQGDSAGALKTLGDAATKEDSEGLGDLAIPAREMLGDMYLESKRPGDALAAYRASLVLAPNRFDSLLGAGRAARDSGDTKDARSYFDLLIHSNEPGADRPGLAEARAWLAGTQ